MNIMGSILGREIQAIISDKDKPVIYRWVCEIHVNEQIYYPIKILNLDFEENPEVKYCPNVVVRVAITGGDYYKQILPNDEILEVTLKKYLISQSTDSVDYSAPFTQERYKATIFDKKDAATASNVYDTVSQELLNVTDVVEVQFQLLNKAIEQLRLMTVGGVYRKSTVQDLLQSLLTASFDELEVDDDRKPIGIDMVEPSNTAVQETFIIPHGTTLVDLPDYIQNHSGGIYNSGLGHFIKDEYWYIYPKYNVKRFGQTQRTMTVIRVPPNQLPMVEKTYRVSGDSITILATAEADKFNLSEIKQLNEGNGARFATADNFLEDFTINEDNRALARRGARASEFAGKERPKNSNAAFLNNKNITSNPYVQYSEITKRQGNVFSFTWENSNMDLIVPAMMVTILMLEEDRVVEMSGVLVSVHHSVTLNGQGPTARNYITNSIISVFIDTILDDNPEQ